MDEQTSTNALYERKDILTSTLKGLNQHLTDLLNIPAPSDTTREQADATRTLIANTRQELEQVRRDLEQAQALAMERRLYGGITEAEHHAQAQAKTLAETAAHLREFDRQVSELTRLGVNPATARDWVEKNYPSEPARPSTLAEALHEREEV